MNLKKDYYSIKEVAKILDVSELTIRSWLRKGLLQAKKYEGSNLWRISKEEVNKKISEVS